MEKVIVRLKKYSYPIIITSGLFNNLEVFKSLVCGDQVMIVTNDCISKLYLDILKTQLIKFGVKVDQIILPDGEKYKSLETLERVIYALLINNHGRDTVVIALGGGVIGDLAGFAASVYQRGIRFIQIPTTLLSQVDASIGGKTAVNHVLGKNMIGTFYQPSSVIIDIDCLKTLPEREFSAGLAEIIKYAIIFDSCFFNWLEDNLEELFLLKYKAISYCIRRCCELKSDVVVADEYERNDKRVLLNFGHTYGHAIEAYTGYDGSWLHGEAVSAGMMMAICSAIILKIFNKKDAVKVKKLLLRARLPIFGPKNMDKKDYLFYMMKDKKNISNKMRLVLPVSLGEAKIFSDITDDLILSSIQNCRSLFLF
ncbi:3-dehydroquinate synthase [Candidatus Westeberhardia cardiocondylae]|uniref:3-dehydroquinate synthase n=1 Tax=Candidatus Westeberhardia cardiocondylae TaxID=1594731 RepID=A0A0H5BWG4_9ENTR|nr:3-dehydroquinate synthase [Candidatus Westeberhardia cardiocondylae]MCR3756148.1 3-dehydroquinate synthase [Candidatus Westeberhardia cardiocondylae]CEN32025.1 3-dehydroquinate synthase [Candidatus Westeberhardia cardiocondylae]